MNDLINSLKNINYQINKEILFNYKKLNISDIEFIVILYLINQKDNIYNPKQISNDLDLKLNEVLELINSLVEKGILKIEIIKNNNIRCEVINLDLLYEKIVFKIKKQEDSNNDNIYSLFESEFGRTLSPMECEIISGWIEAGYSDEIIKLALKEAIYNNVNSLRYIDKIIYEWNKKGIKNKEDVENDRKRFKKNNSSKKELFDYDWLNDEGNN